MEINVREVIPDDAEELARLSIQLGYHASVSQTENRLRLILANKDNCLFAATIAKKIIGWIHGSQTFRLESEPFIEIGGMVVDEKYRRKGIGQQLVEKVECWSRERSIRKIRVRCNTKRDDAHNFYRSIGFNEIKEQKVLDKSIQEQA